MIASPMNRSHKRRPSRSFDRQTSGRFAADAKAVIDVFFQAQKLMI
jgi:hypothetical protein